MIQTSSKRKFTVRELTLAAVVAGIAGLMTSYHIGSSAGASITLYQAQWFANTYLFRQSRM